jgi:transposase-like protein
MAGFVDGLSPCRLSPCAAAFCVRWLPVPAGCDRAGGALVPARFGLSYRDVEELLAERGVQVDHVTVFRWVQRFTPLLAEAARPCRRPMGDRWYVDETYVKVGGRWRYVHRAIDQYGQVIDVYVATKRDAAAARAFFHRAITGAGAAPAEVITDRAPVYPRLLDDLFPAAWHHFEQFGNNRIEADHGQLKRRLRPMRHLSNERTATVIITGHAFVQNLRRGHYHLTVGVATNLRLAAAFDELSHAI